jgi:PAS domain S-box-containing protein
VVHDVYRDERTAGYRDAYQQTDIASVICLPLHKEGKFAAAMAVHQKTPRHWTPEEIELVQLVVNRCWEALERARTATVLRQSEEKYRSLFTSIDEGFCVVEMIFDKNDRPVDYRFVDTNPMFETQTGLPDAKGKTARQLLPDLEQTWFDIYGEVARTGKAVRFTEGSNAMNRWFDVNAFRVGPPENRHVAILFSDITKRRRIEQQLVESEARFRALADDAPVMIWQADEEARITYANRTYLDFLGVKTVEEFQGLAWQTVTHPDDVQRIYDCYREAAAARLPYEFEHRVKEARSGQYRHLHVQGKPRFTAAGEFVGYLGVVIDITERKEFVRELEQRVQERTMQLLVSNEQLERSNAELEQFAYIASHDLQEPLRKIKTFADRLNREPSLAPKEPGARYLEKIIDSADRMHTLILGVLEYSKLSHSFENFEAVDLNVVLRNVLQDFELTLEQTNASVTHDDLPTVEAVALQMNQLFTNLVGNALKFTKPNEAPRLHVGCTMLSQQAVLDLGLEENRCYYDLAFKDNGIGFSEQYAEQIFVIFQRLHGRHLYGGTGIGLALCRRIVNNHQGVIYAASKENEGAVFHVVLPTHINRSEPRVAEAQAAQHAPRPNR